ncbi:hypothetical protein GA0115235_127024 [Streptomyces sp. DpondAA-F4a]|nr:hypothetical protein GA0115235_127024 [Streptomyces sp. DpondAA-F4a]
MTSEILFQGAITGSISVSTGWSGTVSASPGWKSEPSTRKPMLVIRGMSGWITACSSPCTCTSNPATENVSPWPTVCTRPGNAADSCSATLRRVQISAAGSASRPARSRASSKWSGCSCVTRIASAPTAASSSEKPPGSMTSVCPSRSTRTHEWVFLVSVRGDAFILPSCYAGGVVSSRITDCATANAESAAGTPQ